MSTGAKVAIVIFHLLTFGVFLLPHALITIVYYSTWKRAIFIGPWRIK